MRAISSFFSFDQVEALAASSGSNCTLLRMAVPVYIDGWFWLNAARISAAAGDYKQCGWTITVQVVF